MSTYNTRSAKKRKLSIDIAADIDFQESSDEDSDSIQVDFSSEEEVEEEQEEEIEDDVLSDVSESSSASFDDRIKERILNKLLGVSDIEENIPWIDEIDIDAYDPMAIREIDILVNAELPSFDDIMKTNLASEKKAQLIEQLYIMRHESPDYTTMQAMRRHFLVQYEQLLQYEKHYEKKEADLLKRTKRIDNSCMKHRVLDLDADDLNKRTLFDAAIRLEKTPNNKASQWLEEAVKLPFQKRADANFDLTAIRNLLDENIYGLQHVKDRIMEIMNNRITNPDNCSEQSIALVGPPGCGKTEIMMSLSHALSIPFQKIALGGATDVSFLEGHGYTYEGSMPGAIVRCMQKNAVNNGIIYFDEFDKLSASNKGKEVCWSLLHIVDPTQNSSFEDKYLHGIQIDLSNVFFCYSMNDETMIPDSALLDRVNVIRIDGYDTDEKVQIAKRFLLPKHIRRVGMANEGLITIDDETLRFIVRRYAPEKGVRKLNFILGIIVDKFNLIRNAPDNAPVAYRHIETDTVTPEIVDLFMKTADKKKQSYTAMYM